MILCLVCMFPMVVLLLQPYIEPVLEAPTPVAYLKFFGVLVSLLMFSYGFYRFIEL